MSPTSLSGHAAGISTLAQMVLYAPPVAVRLLLRSYRTPPQAAVLPAFQRWTRANSGAPSPIQRQQAQEIILMLHESGVDFNACMMGGQSMASRLRQSGFPPEALAQLHPPQARKGPSL